MRRRHPNRWLPTQMVARLSSPNSLGGAELKVTILWDSLKILTKSRSSILSHSFWTISFIPLKRESTMGVTAWPSASAPLPYKKHKEILLTSMN